MKSAIKNRRSKKPMFLQIVQIGNGSFDMNIMTP
jgi:hypothetical protein